VEILKTSSPRKQKALGRDVDGHDEAKWFAVRSAIVRRGNILKFTQCTNVTSIGVDDGDAGPTPLRELLLATGDDHLVEASPFDRVWGIGYKAEEAMHVDKADWEENLLGKALMEVRDQMRKGQE